MDPRKTAKIADFDRVLRESRQQIIIARPVIAVGSPPRAASLSQTLVWGSQPDAPADSPHERSPFGERTSLNDLKAASAPSLAEELEARVNEVTRPRARVEVESALVQRLAAELWASQASAGLATMATTWRDQPLERPSQAELGAGRGTLPEPELATPESIADEPITPALSPLGRVLRSLRRLQLPERRGTRALRIACGALCAVCVAIGWMSASGLLDARDPARAAQPAPAPKPPKEASAVVRAPAKAPPPASAVPVATWQPSAAVAMSNVTPRSAIDALIAGKHELALTRYRALAQSQPANPAYQAAARILAETDQADAEGL